MSQATISPAVKSQLKAYLAKRGFELNEETKLPGKSGVEHSFDILAYNEVDGARRSLGIDFISGEKKISLEQVVVFDSKAYETSIDNKVIVEMRLGSGESRGETPCSSIPAPMRSGTVLRTPKARTGVPRSGPGTATCPRCPPDPAPRTRLACSARAGMPDAQIRPSFGGRNGSPTS